MVGAAGEEGEAGGRLFGPEASWVSRPAGWSGRLEGTWSRGRAQGGAGLCLSAGGPQAAEDWERWRPPREGQRTSDGPPGPEEQWVGDLRKKR